jgi:hypothetical protein
MATETITVAKLARVQDVDFVNRFNGGIQRLLALLGVTESIQMAPGTQLKIYKTSGTLKSGAVPEGAEIPLSEYQNPLLKTITVEFDKWRKQTTLEAITKRGYTQAVTQTDNAMIRDIQRGIRQSIFDFLATGLAFATGESFQKTLANAWGALEVSFEDDSASPVYFVNPLDIAEYLGSAAISLQTTFGFSYVENFLGLGTVIIDSKVPKDTVYATARENINVYHADISSAEGFEMYSDEVGLVGINHSAVYNNVTYETVAVSALTIFPEYADRIIIAKIEPETP